MAPRYPNYNQGGGGITMTIFSEGRGRVIDVNPSPAFRLLGIAVVGFLVALLLFSSVAKVESGNVGVLTLFGRVTGEVLSEGVHLVYPFKSNNEMSIRTQEIKESASVPSSEGLRSEEHTSELQSRGHLVCRLLLEKKKNKEHREVGARTIGLNSLAA